EIDSADDAKLQRLLRLVPKVNEPRGVALLFRFLGHPSQAVRALARRLLRAVGWDKATKQVEELVHRDDANAVADVLNGLAALKAHPRAVKLLDRLAVSLQGDLRNRAILLLEHKRLGLGLGRIAALFKEIHSPYRIDKVLGQGLFTAAYLAHTDG